MCAGSSWIDTRNKIRDLRTRLPRNLRRYLQWGGCHDHRFTSTPELTVVSRVHGVGTATTDDDVGGGGRSTGRSCRNSPTFTDPLETQSEICPRIIRECPSVPEPVYHPDNHPILHKHTWPVQVGCSLTTSVLCPFCPVLNRGYRTRYVTKHPEAGGYDSFLFNTTHLFWRISVTSR